MGINLIHFLSFSTQCHIFKPLACYWANIWSLSQGTLCKAVAWWIQDSCNHREVSLRMFCSKCSTRLRELPGQKKKFLSQIIVKSCSVLELDNLGPEVPWGSWERKSTLDSLTVIPSAQVAPVWSVCHVPKGSSLWYKEEWKQMHILKFSNVIHFCTLSVSVKNWSESQLEITFDTYLKPKG